MIEAHAGDSAADAVGIDAEPLVSSPDQDRLQRRGRNLVLENGAAGRVLDGDPKRVLPRAVVVDLNLDPLARPRRVKPGGVLRRVIVIDPGVAQIALIPFVSLRSVSRLPETVVVELGHEPVSVLADAVVIDTRRARTRASEVRAEPRVVLDQVVVDPIPENESLASIPTDAPSTTNPPAARCHWLGA